MAEKIEENSQVKIDVELERENEKHEEKFETSEDGTKIKTTKHSYQTRQVVEIDDKNDENQVKFKFDYEPPKRDEALPDLNDLMKRLDSNNEMLEKPLPPLFHNPEHVDPYKKIIKLQTEIEDEKVVDDYIEKFDNKVKDDVLMIGSISLEEVQEEEKRLRDEHIAYREQEKEEDRDKLLYLRRLEEEAKRRVAEHNRLSSEELMKRKEDLERIEQLAIDRMQKSFLKSEAHLISVLESRKGEVKSLYGDLSNGEGYYGGSKGRRWKVDWDKTPQPIQIKLKSLRGVKDKLPNGRYIIMVSLYNRLGGHVMRWSKLKGQLWGGASFPLNHDGNFYNTEMKFDQSVFTTLPSKPDIRPGMILVFELFLLRGEVVATDRVVGWGAFPIADGKFDVVEGKYKCGFLRGEMDYKIEKHEKLEELMASDMDHWLCNFYFEIIKLPRYLAGQKEYEVELQFSSGILGFPDRVDIGDEEYRDGEAPIAGSLLDVKKQSSSSTLNNNNNNSYTSFESKSIDDDDDNNDKKLNEKNKNGGGELRKRRRPVTTLSSRRVHKEHKIKVVDLSDDSQTDYDDDDAYIMKKEEGFYPVKGQTGLWYKKHRYNPQDHYFKRIFALLPRTPLLNPKQKRKKLTYLEQLDQHSFAVKKPFSDKGHIVQRNFEKLQYIGRQMMAELGFSQWRSREFWGMVLMFLIVFWIRMYMHYIGQWIFLQGLEIPINKFDFLPYTVNLNYQNTLLHIREEVALVLLGPFTNVFIFVLLVVCSWACQRFLGSFPEIGSKFTIACGIEAFLDPALILAIDCILKRWQKLGGDIPIADFAKLYWTFERIEGSGLAGIFITILLYLFTCFASASVLYMYFLRLHNNGRMLDIYWRLHGSNDVFFLPYDLEISNHELSFITKKAEQYRGEEGERRKIAVYDYVWEEESIEETVWDENGQAVTKINEGKKEITTHISIHTLHLDGLRELYRHFLRLPDGAICEVFGDVTIPGIDKDVTKLIQKDSQMVFESQNNQPRTFSNISLLKMADGDRLPTSGEASFRPMTADSITSNVDDIHHQISDNEVEPENKRYSNKIKGKNYENASKVAANIRKK